MRDNELLKRIEVNPRVMLGKPVIRGTRIPVEQILRKLVQNIAHDEIIADFPQLTPQDIQAALYYRTLFAERTDFGCRNLLRWPCCQSQQRKPHLCQPKTPTSWHVRKSVR